MPLQFGPFERLLDFNFPAKMKVYWCWKRGGNLDTVFPGNKTWSDTYLVSGILHPVQKLTSAIWDAGSNHFNFTRNPVLVLPQIIDGVLYKGDDMRNFFGIAHDGSYTPALRASIDSPTGNSLPGSSTGGGFFTDKKSAINFATNVMTKSINFSDPVSKHSWSAPWSFSWDWVPYIYETTLPDGSIISTHDIVTFQSPAAYRKNQAPHPTFTSIEIWETDWPEQGTGPKPPNTNPQVLQILPAPGGFAVFNGFSQVSDSYPLLSDATEAKEALQNAANKKRKLFIPKDHFPFDFIYNQRLITTIGLSNGDDFGVFDQKPPPIEVCTFPASISPVGGFADVTDSCGNKVPTGLGFGPGFDVGIFVHGTTGPNGGVNGTVNPGFVGPVGLDYTGFEK